MFVFSLMLILFISRNLKHCNEDTIILSTRLDTRLPWRADPLCSEYSIRYNLIFYMFL